MNSWVGVGEGKRHRMNEEKTVIYGQILFCFLARHWVHGEPLRVQLSSSLSSSKYFYEVASFRDSELGLHRELHSSGISLLDHAWSKTRYWCGQVQDGFKSSIWFIYTLYVTTSSTGSWLFLEWNLSSRYIPYAQWYYQLFEGKESNLTILFTDLLYRTYTDAQYGFINQPDLMGRQSTFQTINIELLWTSVSSIKWRE